MIEGFDKESSSSSGSDDDASESESEDESDVQSQSANGGMKRVLHKHSAQMPRKKSPAEVDLNNGKVTAHGLEWKFVDDVSVQAKAACCRSSYSMSRFLTDVFS